jgi:hypothetical protein
MNRKENKEEIRNEQIGSFLYSFIKRVSFFPNDSTHPIHMILPLQSQGCKQ